MEPVKLPPKAEVLIEAMRDIGYSFESAVADIIDNSITARSKNLHIIVDWNGADSKMAIVDDGYGMSPDTILEAMRPGSTNPQDERDKNDLGRFGLGLKTASFSQCRKLTVVSTREGETSGYCWDLDYIAQAEDWVIQKLSEKEIQNLSFFDRLNETGTLVLWENLDRVVDSSHSQDTEKYFYDKIDVARKHLEMVFHRYLQGEAGIRSIKMWINNDPLVPFDPFNSKHPATQLLPLEKLPVGNAEITVQPYILPHHSKTKPKDYEYYAGDAGYLRNQGFYIYRNARLLIYGTWFRLTKQDELTKLARVKIDLPNSLDHLWTIDVKKSKATPPNIIKHRLKKIIDQITSNSKKVYRTRGTRLLDGNICHVWIRNVKSNEIFYTVNKEHPIIKQFINLIGDTEKMVFNNLISLIEGQFPVDTLYSDVANKPEEIKQFQLEEEMITYLIEEFWVALVDAGTPKDEILKTFSVTEPFRTYATLCEKVLAEKGIHIGTA